MCPGRFSRRYVCSARSNSSTTFIGETRVEISVMPMALSRSSRNSPMVVRIKKSFPVKVHQHGAG